MGSSTVIIGGQYRVLGKIGEGSFGEVYRATHIDTGIDYAIKREPINVPHPQLIHEAKMYEKLKGEDGVAKMHWFGREGAYHALVLDLLGPNLKQVRREVETFPLSFVIELGVQIITIIEGIHRRGIVYRDIKPENFLLENDVQLPLPSSFQKAVAAAAMACSSYADDHPIYFFNDTRQRQQSIDTALSISPGSGSPLVLNYGRPRVSIVDFGLATYYCDASGKHLPNRGSARHKIGTARYASINIHNGREHSRRDDIESIGYILLEMLLGKLPWAGISARNSHQGWAKMRDLKEEIELDELCDGLPRGFMAFIGYARSLKFDEQPDYDHLRHLLRSCAGRGPESQTVRCHRGVSGGFGTATTTTNTSCARSLESAFRELDLHAGDHYNRSKGNGGASGHMMDKENCNGGGASRVHDLQGRDWRFRPDKENQGPGTAADRRPVPQGRYNPGSVWTTTPPDEKKAAGSTLIAQSQKEHFGNKDKAKNTTECSSAQEWSLQDQEEPTMQHADHLYDGPPTPAFSTKGQPLRGRKYSWGEEEPSARWGEDEDRPPPPSPDRDNTGAVPAHGSANLYSHPHPHHPHHSHHRGDSAAGLGTCQVEHGTLKDKDGSNREPWLSNNNNNNSSISNNGQPAASKYSSRSRNSIFPGVGRAPQDARLYSTEPPYNLLPQSPLQDVFVSKLGSIHPLSTSVVQPPPSSSDNNNCSSSQPPTPTQPIPISGNPMSGRAASLGRNSISGYGHGAGGQGRWRNGRKASLVSDSAPFFPNVAPNTNHNTSGCYRPSGNNSNQGPSSGRGPLSVDNASTTPVLNGKGGGSQMLNGHGNGGGVNGHHTVGFSQGRRYNNGNNNANGYPHHPQHHSNYVHQSHHHPQSHYGERNDCSAYNNNDNHGSARWTRTRKRSTASLSSLHDHAGGGGGSGRNHIGSGFHTIHSGGEWSKHK